MKYDMGQNYYGRKYDKMQIHFSEKIVKYKDIILFF